MCSIRVFSIVQQFLDCNYKYATVVQLYYAATFIIVLVCTKLIASYSSLFNDEILRRLVLHVFNYTIITYGYFNIRSWDKDHSTQYETAILIVYRFLRKYKG